MGNARQSEVGDVDVSAGVDGDAIRVRQGSAERVAIVERLGEFGVAVTAEAGGDALGDLRGGRPLRDGSGDQRQPGRRPGGRAGRLLFRRACQSDPPALPGQYAPDGSACVWAELHGSPHMSAGAHVSHAEQVS